MATRFTVSFVISDNLTHDNKEEIKDGLTSMLDESYSILNPIEVGSDSPDLSDYAEFEPEEVKVEYKTVRRTKKKGKK